MPKIKSAVVAYDLITAYGEGIELCWEGISANRSSISKVNRFSTQAFQSENAATVAGLEYLGSNSLAVSYTHLTLPTILRV